MSEAVLPLFKDERVREWQHVGRLVQEASSLGAAFRIAGNRVVIETSSPLPSPLHTELVALTDNRVLRAFLLGGEDPDQAALAFADKLGVGRELVTTRDRVRQAVRQLSADLRE